MQMPSCGPKHLDSPLCGEQHSSCWDQRIATETQDASSLLVVTCRDLAQHDLLSSTPTQGHAHHVSHLRHSHQQVLAGQVLSETQSCTATRDDADLQQRLSMLKEPSCHCMACLVICNSLALFLADHLSQQQMLLSRLGQQIMCCSLRASPGCLIRTCPPGTC